LSKARQLGLRTQKNEVHAHVKYNTWHKSDETQKKLEGPPSPKAA